MALAPGAVRWSLLAGVVLLGSAWAAPGAAWGPEGHRITGAIAERYLAPPARRAVRELLDGRTLADVAFWADEVRGRPEYEWTRPLHYVNVPRDATGVDVQRDCPGGLCVVQAIIDAARGLRDPHRSTGQRAEALKFLVHFVGDVHQPMHVAYGDDLGGNRLPLKFFDQETNLHRLWDSGLLRRRLGGTHWRRLSRTLIRESDDTQVASWASTLDPVPWADESLQITRRIYRELPRGPAAEALGEAYYRRNIDEVLRRLTMAGVRIAALLNTLLADGPPDPGAPSSPAP
jgi:hypothetical protein